MKLYSDQIKAATRFTQFLINDQKYLIITGGAGSGKSTLISHLLTTVKNTYKMINLLKQEKQKQLKIALTATTNPAVAVLQKMNNFEATTIHSFLKLVVKPNFSTGETDLIKRKDCSTISNFLIIIDEASFIDDNLFHFLERLTVDCKIVLIGDQNQLAPIGQKITIIEKLDCEKIELTQIMRNDGIIRTVGEQFKQTVQTGKFESINFNKSKFLITTNGQTFQKEINEAFTNKNFIPDSIKIIAWTNSRVIAYNDYVRKIKGYTQNITEGETVVTVKPIIIKGLPIISIDSSIKINKIEPTRIINNIAGNFISFNKHYRAFLPEAYSDVIALLKKLARNKDWKKFFKIKETWLDLRPTYASTVHKTQGNTYDTVFIDLVNIGTCNIASDVARLVYVAITRAAKRVVIYKDLPAKYRAGVNYGFKKN